MTIWIKLKIFGPYDSVTNSGTKFLTIDGKRTLVNPEGNDAFSIRKGRFLPIDYEWETVYEKDKDTKKKIIVKPGLEQAKERFDPAVFEFFKSSAMALKACEKEKKLLSMLPYKKMEAKNKRIREKVEKSRFGQTRPTMDDVIKEANKIGVDIPSRN